MATSQAVFCPKCGRALEGRTVCACGHQVQAQPNPGPFPTQAAASAMIAPQPQPQLQPQPQPQPQPSVPRFCPQCGRPTAGQPVCECGFPLAAGAMPVAYAPAAAPPPPPPIGLWASRAGQRFWSVLSLHQDTAETPWQAGALAVVLRAVLLSLLVTLWVDSALRTLQRSLLGMFGGLLGDFGGLLGNKSMQTFAVVFFGLLLGSALAFGLLYWRGRSRFGDLAAGLADAQWPLLIALLLAWLFSSISTPLALLILVAGIVWGQAVLAAGLQHGGLAFRERVLLQIGIGIVSLGGLVLMVRLAAR